MQMYYAAERRAADANATFMFLLREVITREELAQNIERRPMTWDRFSGYLDKLPSSATPVTVRINSALVVLHLG